MPSSKFERIKRTTSPVARFSSKRVIRGIKNRARGLSKSDRLESSLNLFAVSNKPGFSTHFNLTYHLRLFGERKEKAKEKIIENQLQLQVLIEHDVFRNRQALQHLSIFLSGWDRCFAICEVCFVRKPFSKPFWEVCPHLRNPCGISLTGRDILAQVSTVAHHEHILWS